MKGNIVYCLIERNDMEIITSNSSISATGYFERKKKEKKEMKKDATNRNLSPSKYELRAETDVVWNLRK